MCQWEDEMIDQERLCELVEDFGLDGLEEIIGIFLLEAQQSIEKLEAAGNRDEVLHHLHFIKGCSRNVGAVALGDFCEAMESTEVSALDAGHLSELRRGLTAVQSEITAWTAAQAA